jgi:hypothetical protein
MLSFDLFSFLFLELLGSLHLIMVALPTPSCFVLFIILLPQNSDFLLLFIVVCINGLLLFY